MASLSSIQPLEEHYPSLVRYFRKPRGFEASDEEIIASLEAAMDRLVEDWGSWEVAWGEINRSQRPPLDEQGNPIFDDNASSIGTPGVPSWSGGSQCPPSRRAKTSLKKPAVTPIQPWFILPRVPGS